MEKLKVAPQVEMKIEKTKKIVTKKPHNKPKPRTPYHYSMPPLLSTLSTVFHSVVMIIPAIVIGVLAGIGAAFEVGMKKALETYKDR